MVIFINMEKLNNKFNFVWLSLGGNIGNVKQNFDKALALIKDNKNIKLLKISSLYKTKAWGKINQPDFLNICVKISTNLLPENLLNILLDIEQQIGRIRVEKWGERCIDIDIVCWENDLSWNSPNLTLPHPHITERIFVLAPLMEISPELVVKGKNIKFWYNFCLGQKFTKL
ncbi:2-amino-4-hydroxy-6-hydroxymethyldihydropteridine diphosphokinase [Bartonella sp. DGB1]|uniref:2-amino-4-hydroxy-6- hydroxymethyldihydropteridine diphosphokinase n=1 Tax=Bartonella sp. DGB1 TaxID=3239807 RepID=UPI0035234D7A